MRNWVSRFHFYEVFWVFLTVFLSIFAPLPPPPSPPPFHGRNFSSKFSYEMINRLTDFTVKKKLFRLWLKAESSLKFLDP